MEIKKENVLAAYKAAREAGADSTCKVLEELFGKDTFKPEDVTERIKTFEDACRELGENHPLVLQYRFNYSDEGCWNDNGYTADLEAYLKLRIICAALNEGWKPQFTDDEVRYFPWFCICTKEELEEMDEEERSCVVGRASDNAYAIDGLVYASANSASSYTNAYFGSRLAFKSKELAVYCGQQFIDIWADFVC